MGLQALCQHGLYLGLRVVGIGNGQGGSYAVVGFATEALYLALTFNNETDGYTLYTSCRQGGLDLTPQYGRQLEAYQAVEHAACLLGIHQVHVDMTWCLDGLKDGWFGDFVEYDTVGLFFVQSKHLAQMP